MRTYAAPLKTNNEDLANIGYMVEDRASKDVLTYEKELLERRLKLLDSDRDWLTHCIKSFRDILLGHELQLEITLARIHETSSRIGQIDTQLGNLVHPDDLPDFLKGSQDEE